MQNKLLILVCRLGVAFHAFSQTPSKGADGTWSGTLEAGDQKLRIIVTITRSDAGAYAGKFESLDQGATVPFETVTVNGDNVRMEGKADSLLYQATRNKERTDDTGKFNRDCQACTLAFTR